MYEIYTDGACSKNGKQGAVGGWAYVILTPQGNIKTNSGYEKDSTNQRMELLAAIKACEHINEIEPFCEAIIYTDSAYLSNCVAQNWWRAWENNGWRNSKKEPVANAELWKRLIPFFEKYKFIKVKGHSDNIYNQEADKLAVAARIEGDKND